MIWNKKGFSILEALIAMSILYGGIVLSMNFMNEQTKSRTIRGKQSIQRYIAIQVTQHINANWAKYPFIKPLSPSQKVVYVGCLTKNGQLFGDYKFKLIDNFDEAVATDVCPKEKTHYEVRFFWLNPSSDEVKINLLTKYPGSAASLAVHNFKIFAK